MQNHDPSQELTQSPLESEIFHETEESKKARGKAECTGAAVEVFRASIVIDELMMQIVEAEKLFADSDAKFMKSLTFLLGGGFKEPENY